MSSHGLEMELVGCELISSFLLGGGRGRGVRGGCVTIVTIELKTLSRISLLTGKGVFLGSKIPAGKLLKETWR